MLRIVCVYSGSLVFTVAGLSLDAVRFKARVFTVDKGLLVREYNSD